MEIRRRGGRATWLVGDVTDSNQVSAMVRGASEKLGPISIVIHAAAWRSHRPFLELTFEEWQRTRDVTLKGAYLLTRATLPTMTEAGYGRYVFIGGSSSTTGLPIGCAHIAAAKGALRGFARALAQESSARGVTANVVSPGLVATDARIAAGSSPNYSGWDPLRSSALGRMVTVDEVTSTVLFLCDPTAQAITGAQIAVDGGTFAFGD